MSASLATVKLSFKEVLMPYLSLQLSNPLGNPSEAIIFSPLTFPEETSPPIIAPAIFPHPINPIVLFILYHPYFLSN